MGLADGKLNRCADDVPVTRGSVMNDTSGLASLRALRNQIVAKLEQSEDFRVLRGIDFVLAQEARLPQGHALPQGQAVQPGARVVQDGLTASMATPPSAYPNSGVSAEEPSLTFPPQQTHQNTRLSSQEPKPLDFSQVRAAS